MGRYKYRSAVVHTGTRVCVVVGPRGTGCWRPDMPAHTARCVPRGAAVAVTTHMCPYLTIVLVVTCRGGCGVVHRSPYHGPSSTTVNLRWDFHTAGRVVSCPVISGAGYIFFGSYDGDVRISQGVRGGV